jgi:hypothetical protein
MQVLFFIKKLPKTSQKRQTGLLLTIATVAHPITSMQYYVISEVPTGHSHRPVDPITKLISHLLHFVKLVHYTQYRMIPLQY